MNVLSESPILTIGELLRRLGDIPPDRVRFKPAPGTATKDDLLRPENEGCELVEGTLVEKAVGWQESTLGSWLLTTLNNFVLAHNLGAVTGEQGMVELPVGFVPIRKRRESPVVAEYFASGRGDGGPKRGRGDAGVQQPHAPISQTYQQPAWVGSLRNAWVAVRDRRADLERDGRRGVGVGNHVPHVRETRPPRGGENVQNGVPKGVGSS